MYARVSTVETSPAKLDTATQFFRERVLPQLQHMDGSRGLSSWAIHREASYSA